MSVDKGTHLLSMADLSRQSLLKLVENGEQLLEVLARDIKKVPTLRGRTVVNLFLEPSTRTRISFEIAAKRLSADSITISGGGSSTEKGETLLDTARTMEAMGPDVVILRHKDSGAPNFLATQLQNTALVNAGDGMHEHPTQALLDLLCLHRRLHRQRNGVRYGVDAGSTLSNLKVAIVGDVRHSRVARSAIIAHSLLGNHVRLVGPPTLVPLEFASEQCFPGKIQVFHDLEAGLDDVDVIVCLRIQRERLAGNFFSSLAEYSAYFSVTEERIQRCSPKALVMHPGPANRGVEIASEVADGPRSLIRDQVKCGVAMRMAVLLRVLSGEMS